MQHNEGSFSAKDGLKLYYQSWLPDDEPKAILQIAHGLGEHSGRYQNAVDYFVPKGFGIFAVDMRGHGLSGGKRGHIPNYETIMDDVEISLARIRDEHPASKIFIYGHSLGGNLALHYALRRPAELSGVIATGPWLKLPQEPPALMVLFKILSVITPSLTLNNQLDPSGLSRDPAVAEAYVDDPLVHDRISARLFAEAAKAAAWTLEHAAELTLPAILLHGSEDRLTSSDGTQLFHERVENSVFHLYEGLYHEVHNEPEKATVFKDIKSWLDGQL